MSSTTDKSYIECGVQTEPPASKTTIPPLSTAEHSVTRINSPPHLHLYDASPHKGLSSPSNDHSRTSTQFDSAYMQAQDDFSFASTDSSANQSMTTTTRAYKPAGLPTNRPSTLSRSSSRIASLPEATPKFRMKSVMERKTARVVSMPVPSLQDTSSDSIDMADPFISEGEERTRIRVRSQATDVPHTPSAPSSPESVVIIANNSNQLSNDFLRRRVDDESSPESEDEGWITWTKSPPRPIPALHGPLSLPYARCPSGAEGTIIEEPESLPRVIWGLESDEASSGRSSIKPVNIQSTVHKQGVNDSQRRPANIGREHRPTNTQTNKPVLMEALRPTPPMPLRPTSAQQLPQPPAFILKHSEPIDLGRLTGHSAEGGRNTPAAANYPVNPSQSSYQHSLPTPELVHDISPELQAMLFTQERLKNYGLSPPTQNFARGSLSASSSSASLLDALTSTRSPIVLDDLANPYHRPEDPLMSALDVAQRYQQHYQKNILPTPPTSTSPVWSSTFAPYHSGLFSPEFLAAAGLNSGYLAQAMATNLDPSYNHFNRPMAGHLDNSRANSSYLAPAVHINAVTGQKLPPRLAAEYARRRPNPEKSSDGLQLLTGLSHQTPSGVRDSTKSPTVPKAPPNTPRGTLPAPQSRRLDHLVQSNALADSVSPPSPHEVATLGLPQHTRSIPLSRLVQRRLSTVPEEDNASSADGRTPPAHARYSAPGASGLHLYLSPSRRTTENVATLPPLSDTVGTRYDLDSLGQDKTRNMTPSVKLPGISTKAGLGSCNERQSKEVPRRQGSNNTNAANGGRGENGKSRGQKRSGRGRRGRSVGAHVTERVDGGIVVKS